MANETQKAAPAKPDAKADPKAAAPATKAAAAAPVKKYELARPVKIDGAVRPIGGEIAATELRPKDLELFLADGTLIDADAPIPPSKAEGFAAFDALARVAQAVGAVGRDGATYTIGGRKFAGLTAFRAGVTATELEAAIVEAKAS